MVGVLQWLAQVVAGESAHLLRWVHEWLKQSVEKRNITSMREVSFIIRSPDLLHLAGLSFGPPNGRLNETGTNDERIWM